MTLTDEIYAELKNGLWTGLDYDELRSKYEKSKGPFYNALQMVLADTSAEATKLSSEVKALRRRGDEEKAKLKNLAEQQEKAINEIEARRQEVKALGRDEDTIKARIQELSTELDTRAGLLSQAQELEKKGFDSGRLQHLHDVIIEIGTKQGQKPDEAIARFFIDLEDYDAKIGFGREIQRLETIAETKRLEAEKWQAQADNLSRRYKELSEAITATQSLTKQGVKAEQVVSWNRIVSKLGGPEELQDKLGQYKSMSELVNARKEEAGSYELKLTKAQNQLETLEKERAKIEAAIESLKLAGLEQVRAMTDEVMKQLKAQVAKEVKEIQAVGQSAKSQFDDYLTELNIVTERAYQLGEKIGQMGIHLEKYGAVRDILESHQAASEAVK